MHHAEAYEFEPLEHEENSLAKSKRSKPPGEATFGPEWCPSPELEKVCVGHWEWPDSAFSRGKQNDAQTSNTRKQARRDESSAQPAAGNSLRKGEVHRFGRQKLEFHNLLISDSGYLEENFKNMKIKGESCRRCTTSGDPSTQNQHIDRLY